MVLIVAGLFLFFEYVNAPQVGEPVPEDSLQYFGNEATGDLTGDGLEDRAFLIFDQPGGSGTFYYVVAEINIGNGDFRKTNSVFLGDRIAPQTTEIRDGRLIVNYAERKSGEEMTARPSVGVSKYLKVENFQLVEFIP